MHIELFFLRQIFFLQDLLSAETNHEVDHFHLPYKTRFGWYILADTSKKKVNVAENAAY